MKRMGVVFGTRPEVIKLFPLIKIMEEDEGIELKIIFTGQHKEMAEDLFPVFQISPDYSLNIMKEKQTLSEITERILERLDKILVKERFDLVLVQGDTTTTFVSSLVSFYHKIPVAHVEAGLRTHNRYFPFPEEMNRTLVGKLATLHFAPTKIAKENLLREGVDEKNIFITGNTIVDAVIEILKIDKSLPFKIPEDRKLIVVTAHRRENWDKGLKNIALSIKEIALKFPEEVYFVFPLHKNPIVREKIVPIISNLSNVKIVEPLNYVDFIHLLKRSFLILSDSGGIQEEIPTLGKPMLLLRNETERPEAIESGFVFLVGTERERIVDEATKIIKNGWKPKVKNNPFGDGRASERILKIIKEYLYGNI